MRIIDPQKTKITTNLITVLNNKQYFTIINEYQYIFKYNSK